VTNFERGNYQDVLDELNMEQQGDQKPAAVPTPRQSQSLVGRCRLTLWNPS
jgi:hypothetical protein